MRSFPAVPQLSSGPPLPPHDPSQQPFAHSSTNVPSALQEKTESAWHTLVAPLVQVASSSPPPASGPSATGDWRASPPQAAAPPTATSITRAENARANGSVPPDMARNVDHAEAA